MRVFDPVASWPRLVLVRVGLDEIVVGTANRFRWVLDGWHHHEGVSARLEPHGVIE